MVFLLLVFIIMVYIFIYTITSWFFIWACIVLFTMIAITVINSNGGTSKSVIIYFVGQEIWGSIFLLFFSWDVTNFYFLMIKGGFAPFHIWITKIIYGLPYIGFAWITSLQKTPYFIILMLWGEPKYMLVVLVGSLLPLLQALIEKHSVILLFLLLTSSGNNILLLSWFEPVFTSVMLSLYLILIYSLITNITSIGHIVVSYEMVFTIISFPGSAPFYVNIIMMYSLSSIGGIIFVLFLVGFVLNIMSGYNLIININSTSKFSGKIVIYMFIFMLLLFLL